MKKDSDIAFILKQAGKEKYKIVLAAVTGVFSSLLELVPYVILYQIVMLALNQSEASVLWKYLIFACAAAVLHIVFYSISLSLSHYSAFSILYKLRVRAVEHMGNLNLGFFREKSAGEIKKSIDEDIEKLELFIAHQIPDFVSSVITPLFIIIYMISLNWMLGILLFIPVILGFIIQGIIFRGYAKRTQEYNSLLIRLHTTIVEYINGINIFKAFNLTAKSFRRYSETTNEYKEYWKNIARSFAGKTSLYLLIMDSGLLFSVPLGGILYLSGYLNISSFVLLLLLSSIFMSSFRKILTLGASLSRLLTGAQNVRDILERQEQLEIGSSKKQPIGNLEFKNVTFKYEEKDVIKNMSFNVKAGSTVALVGPSGSGKTTLAMLIGRFWDIENGTLLLDGIDIKEYGMEILMENTSFVFQDVFMLNDTILENLRMGMDVSRDEIINAAEKARIHDFIMTMKDGYDTRIGDNSGIKLSGGEKQRISVARAILKNAPIVVLDEVTSYSDIENEIQIQEALRTLLQGRTGIIIAHRLYTIMHVDNIIVLDKGEIAEQGTHNELLENEGLYKKLWETGMEV